MKKQNKFVRVSAPTRRPVVIATRSTGLSSDCWRPQPTSISREEMRVIVAEMLG